MNREIIIAKITKKIDLNTEFEAITRDKREIRIDPCVGLAVAYSIFKDYDFIGKEFEFEGGWYSKDANLFLADNMYDVQED